MSQHVYTVIINNKSHSHGTAGYVGHIGESRHGCVMTEHDIKRRFKSWLVQARQNSTSVRGFHLRPAEPTVKIAI
jgi:hypothetical protein